MRDAAGVRDGAANVVDQLLADEGLVVPDRVKYLPDRERRRRVRSHQPQRLLVLRWDAVLQPEQVVGFEALAELGGLDRGHAVMPVVQQWQLGTELAAHGLEHGRNVAQIGTGVPRLLRRQVASAGWL